MFKNKKSFFERLAGSISIHDDVEEEDDEDELKILEEAEETKNKEQKEERHLSIKLEPDSKQNEKKEQTWLDEEGGQLTVDMYQTPTEIVIRTMVAGVPPEELDVSIAQDMITIKGKRHQSKEINEENYYYKELYWGNFSRSILLPHEIDPEKVKATSKNGLLTIRMPKISKDKTQKVNIDFE